MNKKSLFLFIITLVCCAGCSTAVRDKITQTSTIDALLSGAYDGNMSCRQQAFVTSFVAVPASAESLVKSH
jgi:hypothetical protein